MINKLKSQWLYRIFVRIMKSKQIIIRTFHKSSNKIIDKDRMKSIKGRILDLDIMITLWEKDAFDSSMNLDTKSCYGHL